MVVAIEDAGFKIRDQIQWIYGCGFLKSHNLKGDWSGWGTALKPANELIVLARKPLEGTVAKNVEKYGTGGLNIDGCRISTNGEAVWKVRESDKISDSLMCFDKPGAGSDSMFKNKGGREGRWPANVIFDEEAAKVLDEQSGVLKTAVASRFFYVAKSSRRERNAGLEEVPEKTWKDQGYRNNESTHLSPHAGAGRTSANANHHPTVKPIKLMQYLIKLVTPPGGVVLDPFMGSGSTGCAARSLGFDFIGCEMNEAYFEIAKRRIAHHNPDNVDCCNAQLPLELS